MQQTDPQNKRGKGPVIDAIKLDRPGDCGPARILLITWSRRVMLAISGWRTGAGHVCVQARSLILATPSLANAKSMTGPRPVHGYDFLGIVQCQAGSVFTKIGLRGSSKPMSFGARAAKWGCVSISRPSRAGSAGRNSLFCAAAFTPRDDERPPEWRHGVSTLSFAAWRAKIRYRTNSATSSFPSPSDLASCPWHGRCGAEAGASPRLYHSRRYDSTLAREHVRLRESARRSR